MLTEPWLKPQPRTMKQCCVHSLPENAKQFEHKKTNVLTLWKKKKEHHGTVACNNHSIEGHSLRGKVAIRNRAIT